MQMSSPLQPNARKQLARLDRLLQRAYGTPEALLGNKADPLDEAVYIILSYQTDLARFGETWSRLRAAYPSWEALERAPQRQIERVLREGGLHRQKARTLKRFLASVRRAAGSLSLDMLHGLSDAPAERVLTRLPGLSWKGARCVLLYSLGRAVFPVDGNTFRILRRLGVLRRSAIYRRRSLHDALQDAVQPARRKALHINLVVHGQRTCLPVTPACFRCPARSACAMVGVSLEARKTGVATTTPPGTRSRGTGSGATNPRE